jgi:hypothetical protein
MPPYRMARPGLHTLAAPRPQPEGAQACASERNCLRAMCAELCHAVQWLGPSNPARRRLSWRSFGVHSAYRISGPIHESRCQCQPSLVCQCQCARTKPGRALGLRTARALPTECQSHSLTTTPRGFRPHLPCPSRSESSLAPQPRAADFRLDGAGIPSCQWPAGGRSHDGGACQHVTAPGPGSSPTAALPLAVASTVPGMTAGRGLPSPGIESAPRRPGEPGRSVAGPAGAPYYQLSMRGT